MLKELAAVEDSMAASLFYFSVVFNVTDRGGFYKRRHILPKAKREMNIFIMNATNALKDEAVSIERYDMVFME